MVHVQREIINERAGVKFLQGMKMFKMKVKNGETKELEGPSIWTLKYLTNL